MNVLKIGMVNLLATWHFLDTCTLILFALLLKSVIVVYSIITKIVINFVTCLVATASDSNFCKCDKGVFKIIRYMIKESTPSVKLKQNLHFFNTKCIQIKFVWMVRFIILSHVNFPKGYRELSCSRKWKKNGKILFLSFNSCAICGL